MTKASHIIVVDDEPAAREMVGDYLKMHGFVVSLCESGVSLRSELKGISADLIVLDLNMPDEDGLSVIRDLRGQSGVPVIMLTATASPVDRIVGLEIGADDYLAKPCELRELVARIRSVLRRRNSVDARSDERRIRRVRFGTKWLDLDARHLRDDANTVFNLTASEFGLLKAFAESPERVLTRERLLDLASARDDEPFDRAIDVRITRLRRKIEPDPTHPCVIQTVRGAGYLFSLGPVPR